MANWKIMDKDFWLNKWETSDIIFHEADFNRNLVAYFNRLDLQPHNTVH